MFRPMLKQALMCLMTLSVMTTQTESGKFLNASDYKELATLTRDGLECQKLCIGKILTKHLKSKQIRAEKLCAEDITSNALCSKVINTERLCANVINATQQICVPAISAPVVCSEQLNATNICSSGLVQANAFQQCGKYRATVTYAAPTPYTLGSLVNFDTILDDPNGDVALFPFTYTAPLSGYYILTAKINQRDLVGTEQVLGVPIANIEVLINGGTLRESYTPFLTFHNEQKTILTSLVSLKAGDQVQMHYHVYVMSDVLGFSPYVGSVTLEANGTDADSSEFKIHYLSSDCTELPCTPCTPCSPTPCALPCSSCVDVHNMSCCEDSNDC